MKATATFRSVRIRHRFASSAAGSDDLCGRWPAERNNSTQLGADDAL